MERRERGQLSQLVGALRVTPRASMRCCGCNKMFLLTRRHSLQGQWKGGGRRGRDRGSVSNGGRGSSSHIEATEAAHKELETVNGAACNG